MTKRTKPLKALIFSVSIGSGHDSVARALAESLLSELPGSEAKIIDTFKYINLVLHKVVFGSYMETLKLTPRVWGYFYEQAQDGEKLTDLGQLFSKVLSPKLEQLLLDVNPDVILATHAFPAGILAEVKKRSQIKVPLAVAVTDFHVHSFWIHQGIDLFFIPAADLSYSLIKAGIGPEKIRPVGIPIGSQFSETIDRNEAKARIGFENDDPIVLVAGGGLGLGRIEQITREILDDQEFNVLMVAGKNQRLLGIMHDMHNPRLKVFGFVENMAQILAASDLVISKPGGVTSAEVLAMAKPLIIYSSLPGQEDRNTDYLLNKGVAIKVKKLDMLNHELKCLWNNGLRLRQMKEMAMEIGSPQSSRLVWDNLREFMGSNV